MIPKRNIMAALQIYRLRLKQLNKEISLTAAKETIGKVEEIKTLQDINIIQNEVDGIHQCLHVLDELLHRS